MQPTEGARARLNESLGMHAPDDISEILQELVGLLPILARMVVNSRRIRDFLRCCDLLSERVF